jgi:hypothetical protein
MTIELIPLGTMKADLRTPLGLAGTPAGHRMIYEVETGRFEGERINATLKGNSAADWLTVGPDGTGTVDVRALVETDDGALVFIQYQGRTDVTQGGRAPVYIAPRFETGDERYRWLNQVQAVGKGSFDGRTLTYELYEIR